MFTSKSDFWMTLAGGAAVVSGLLLCRSEMVTLANVGYDFVQNSLDEKDIPLKSIGGTGTTTLTDEEELQLALKYGTSFVLVTGGMAALTRGLRRTQGTALLLEARRIEQAVNGTVEVGEVSLNVTQD